MIDELSLLMSKIDTQICKLMMPFKSEYLASTEGLILILVTVILIYILSIIKNEKSTKKT